MTRLLIATNNPGKVREVKAICGMHFSPIFSLQEFSLVLEVEEDGQTFEDNAVKKAEALMRITGAQALADDSGLEVDELGGEPGVHTARYAGDARDDAANRRKLLEVLQGVPRARRTARFVSAVALAMPDGRLLEAQGSCEGCIGQEERGHNGFGYDCLFYREDGRSFAEYTSAEKDAVSHRAVALAALAGRLPAFLAGEPRPVQE